MRESITN